MINRIIRGGALSVALLSLSLGACKKDEKSSEPAAAKVDPAAATTPDTKPVPAPTPEPVKVAPAATGDYFYIEASHTEPKPDDPVKVSFPEVKVVTSAIDVTKMSEATAEIEISMVSIDSGVPKRDGHLGSPDYFDAAKFATATIKVMDVKQKEGDSYTAKSEVTVHGVSTTWDVEFKVVEKADAAITIEAEQKFSRLDFGIGKAEGDSAATEVLAKLRVTLPTS
jgi:polyisoprenoid-binding protein YceI